MGVDVGGGGGVRGVKALPGVLWEVLIVMEMVVELWVGIVVVVVLVAKKVVMIVVLYSNAEI